VTWSGGKEGHVRMIDQTLLPGELRIIDVRTVDELGAAIYRLAVRGAPAIGMAAAYGVLLGVQGLAGAPPAEVVARARETARVLGGARPTAVNLFVMLERMVAQADSRARTATSGDEVVAALFALAESIAAEIADECRRMGEIAVELLSEGAGVLTHCNAGALATVGIGTALAPIYVAAERGMKVRVFADETRPLLQGARLTAWELMRAGIDVTLLTDNAAASLMASGEIDIVFVGADRIARNGDVCNKIGTYGVAVLAQEHGIPFYAIAPLSTFDPGAATGAEIPIEKRLANEVTHGLGGPIAPEGVSVYNPAFDVTPAAKVTGLVCERGLIEAPTTERVETFLRRAGRL